MPRQRHGVRVRRSMSETFAALLDVVAHGRWAGRLALESSETVPRAGLRYQQQRGPVLRRGRVIECVAPVSITLHETLLDPPCCVRLRLRWRTEPIDDGSFLRLDASFDLNGAAALRRRHWNGRIHGHCERMLAALQARLAGDAQDSSVSGQKTGSSSITETKVTSDSGSPTLR